VKKESSKPIEKEKTVKQVTPANTAKDAKVTLARPATPGKRPEKIVSEIKEIKEEKIGGKAPQGLISDKHKDEEEESKTSNAKSKPKDKIEDLAPSKTQGGGKIKITSKIGKFADLTTGEETKSSTKAFTAADLESIKNYVQEISKNSNPIGKIIDFLGDDVDSMNKELQSWIKEAKTYKERYDEECK